MTSLHNLYWKSQRLHDQCFALERRIFQIKARGHNCVKTLVQWQATYNEIRGVELEMHCLGNKQLYVTQYNAISLFCILKPS